MSDLYKLQEAAKLVGISYPTLKQWIYKGQIRSIKTAGGHHRIPQSEIERMTGKLSSGNRRRRKPVGLDAISGRNKLEGIITELRFEGLLVQVTIDVSGQQITSIITSDAARALRLKIGARVFALVKATEVMVIRG